MNPLCIYHGHCDDGFGAAWAVRHALGDDVEFYPGVYGKPAPDVTDRDVIMVDFSYKRPVIDEMAAKVHTMVILDHHKTAAADLAGLPPPIDGHWSPGAMRQWQRECNAPSATHALFDMKRSGAGIAWDYFHPHQSRPEFINYLEDRDLWLKRLPGGDEFTIALRSHPQTFAIWDDLVRDGPARLIEEGKSLQRYYRLRCEELKRSAYMTTLAGVPIWVANAPYFAASEVAGELAERGLSFGACYFEVEKGRYQYSLRSRGDFDVSEVAKKFGGGGHAGAAGFTVDKVVHE